MSEEPQDPKVTGTRRSQPKDRQQRRGARAGRSQQGREPRAWRPCRVCRGQQASKEGLVQSGAQLVDRRTGPQGCVPLRHQIEKTLVAAHRGAHVLQVLVD